MFVLFLLSLFALAVVAAPISQTPVTGPQWFTVEWDAPAFTALSGSFIIPSVSSSSGAVFVWPGLQGSAGALQAEVSGGHSNGLLLRDVFYGADTSVGTPPSPGLLAIPGEEIFFNFAQVPGTTDTWVASLSDRLTWSTFTLPGAVMNRAIFAIESVDGLHDFDVTFNNVRITAANASASQWCATAAFNGFGADDLTIQGATADGTACTIDQIVIPSTA
ncbi:hypothetical protein M422DRAFT_774103 [Sphaerobolus stellatus SS14]|nr:hypothetical protein M422DRAFT_774103 [Sphaerobolus stellatus SS14]